MNITIVSIIKLEKQNVWLNKMLVLLILFVTPLRNGTGIPAL